MTRMLALSLLVLVTALPARAQVEAAGPVLTHTGRLMGTGDTPVEGTLAMTFELHETDNPLRNAPVWTDSRQVVLVKGMYAVTLGDVAAGGTALPDAIVTKPVLYLSVRIDGTELQPRQRLSTIPYALRAQRAVLAESVADGSIKLASLEAGLRNAAGKLDADTLDGFDSAAFAPAAIEDKIDAIASTTSSTKTTVEGLAASIGTSLGTELGTVATKVDAVGSKVDAVGSKVDAVGTKLGTPAGASVSADIAALQGQMNTAVTSGIGSLAAKIGDPGSKTLTGQLSDLDTKLGTVSTAVGASGSATSGLSTDVAALKAKVASLEALVTAMTYGTLQTNPGLNCKELLAKNGGHGDAYYWIDTDGPSGSGVAVSTFCSSAPLGGSSNNPGRSCKEIKADQTGASDGVYWVDPDQSGGNGPFQVFCDMTTDGGGWTFYGHVNNDYVAGRFFETNIGTYRADRADDNSTYSRSAHILPFVSHTQTMVTLDTSDPTVARGNSKLVVYQYSAGHTGFNTGPVPCSGLTGYSYRLTLTGAFTTGGTTDACQSNAWYSRTSGNAAYLTLFNSGSSYANYWGSGMGGNDSWYHDGYWYVR